MVVYLYKMAAKMVGPTETHAFVLTRFLAYFTGEFDCQVQTGFFKTHLICFTGLITRNIK